MRTFVLWMTCTLDGREHAVLDSAFADGTEHGRYRAQCQRLIAPRALSAPPGSRCRVCAAATGGLVGERDVNRRGRWLRRSVLRR